jgi:hypothetical protein
MAEKARFTPVRQKMVNLLMTQKPIKGSELFACLWDQEGDFHNIHFHLNYLRSRLKPGYEIICRFMNRTHYYQIMKMLDGEDPFTG